MIRVADSEKDSRTASSAGVGTDGVDKVLCMIKG